MLKFAANLSLMFNELPFQDRFAAAREAGFLAVEFFPPSGIAIERVAALLESHGLTQALANMPLVDRSKGFAALPGQSIRFKAHFEQALDWALAVNAPLLHITCGCVEPADLHLASLAFQENLEWSLQRAEGRIELVIEAINQTAVPGYFIQSLADAQRWTQTVPGLTLIMDVYHAAMEGLDVVDAIHRYLPYAGHVQVAGWPGRHEPNVGDLPWQGIQDALVKETYLGWIGCEYIPVGATLEGLGWLRDASLVNHG
ncbi:TIM barrel protein [Pseudomonas sp. D8002]|uniref:hydroxypyruvate isomerase family protein n=1 Tax=unclassified Pseudomonas TaxID=196821 RepID=UPI0015A3D372|nr:MULTISPECIES: TIM barrel protein [unclassified Pseudomonas]NWA91411.1 TIM barrel protein [Pseudomonas sp. D8002]NWB20980.1 TIM barrel protein [Pseudomonas sp. D4002]